MSRTVVPVGEDFPLTAEHRQAALDGARPHDPNVDEMADRTDGYFDAEHPPTFLAWMQALLRESWKRDHGSYSKWDRAARAGGVYAVGKVILGR